MKISYFHGATKPHLTLNAGAWLTRISTHAMLQAQKRSTDRSEPGYILRVEADDCEVRRPTEADRTDENRGNNLSEEEWVWISTVDLLVLDSVPLTEAGKKFCGPHNMLSPKLLNALCIAGLAS